MGTAIQRKIWIMFFLVLTVFLFVSPLVGAWCSHPYQSLETSVSYWDEGGHEVDYTWRCIDCGAIEQDTIYRSHTGSESCSECPWTWSCPHSDTWIDDYMSYDTTEHVTYYDELCSDCDELLDWWSSDWEPHNWINGTCNVCYYSCEHRSETPRSEIDLKNSTHHRTRSWRECNNCSRASASTWRFDPHSWVNGKCSVCSYSCQHSSETPDSDVDLIYPTHHRTRMWTVCNICKRISSSTWRFDTHSWVNGKCSEVKCDYACLHPNESLTDTWIGWYDRFEHEIDVVYDCDTCSSITY